MSRGAPPNSDESRPDASQDDDRAPASWPASGPRASAWWSLAVMFTCPGAAYLLSWWFAWEAIQAGNGDGVGPYLASLCGSVALIPASVAIWWLRRTWPARNSDAAGRIAAMVGLTLIGQVIALGHAWGMDFGAHYQF